MAAIAPGEGGRGYSAAHLDANYLRYDARNQYTYAAGLVHVALAGPPRSNAVGAGGESKVLRLNAPAGARVYSWLVERQGRKPQLPHPESRDSNETLLSAVIVPYPPELDGSGRVRLFRAEGVYVYALVDPRLHRNRLRMGGVPYLTDSPDSHVYLPSDFVHMQ